MKLTRKLDFKIIINPKICLFVSFDALILHANLIVLKAEKLVIMTAELSTMLNLQDELLKTCIPRLWLTGFFVFFGIINIHI